MDRESLLNKLYEVEFACIDMQLFLNTHPCDTAAIAKFNMLSSEAKMLRDQFEEHFGPLFSYISTSSENYFSWIDEPWPWDRDFLMSKNAFASSNDKEKFSRQGCGSHQGE